MVSEEARRLAMREAEEISREDLEAAAAFYDKLLVNEQKDAAECSCYLDCRVDSHSGRWHQHEGEECPVHPGGEVVG